MAITEPKRLFDAVIGAFSVPIANTGIEKWIVSDLFINNSHVLDRKINLIASYVGSDGFEVKRNLFTNLLVSSGQTFVIGNLILNPNEKLYASSEYDVYAYRDIGNLRFISKTSGSTGNNLSVKFVNPQLASQALSSSVSGNDVTFNLATDATTVPTKASLTTAFANLNNDIVITSKGAGIQGNRISFTFVNSGANQTLAVTSATVVITPDNKYYDVDFIINLATNSSGVVTTTATLLKNLLNANATYTTWCDACVLFGADTGAGVVDVLPKTFLTGGIDATVTTTLQNIYNLVKSNVTLNSMFDVNLYHDDGTALVDVLLKTNLQHGEADLNDLNLLAISGITMVGYGRSV